VHCRFRSEAVIAAPAKLTYWGRAGRGMIAE
jgi:hypothetical protein